MNDNVEEYICEMACQFAEHHNSCINSYSNENDEIRAVSSPKYICGMYFNYDLHKGQIN